MSFATDLQDGLAFLATETAQVFTWKTTNNIPCVANRLKRGTTVGTTVGFGAKEETIQLTLVVSKTDLPTPLTSGGAEVTSAAAMSTATASTAPPSSGHKVTFQGVVYRVVAVSEGPSRAFYDLDLADINR